MTISTAVVVNDDDGNDVEDREYASSRDFTESPQLAASMMEAEMAGATFP